MKQPPQQPAEEMRPTKEVAIKAFLEYLVDPLLPLRSPPGGPLLSNQQKVAKQMHAVVLLYNYYQRKRHAQAEYIDIMPFCKLVVTLKPVLAAYMTSMLGSVPADSENMENQFSLTEKAIEDACKISMSLDVSRDIPDVNEWEVSKVAVFLVNSSKENCALSFNSLTDGVWSLFEKSIDHCVDNQENQDKSKNPNKKKRKRRQNTGEPDLQQLAFSALKEARGIQQSHLTILERHVTYSLDKERTAACCFIMECRSTIQEFEFSVRDIIESLQGPLTKKISGNWTLTQLTEYYNVLPYAGIISNWFSRHFPLISSELLNASISENYYGNDVLGYGKPDSTLSELVDVERQSTENPLKERDNIVSYDFSNPRAQEDACEESYIRARRKCCDLTEGRIDFDNGPESENDEGMDVDLCGMLSGAEILPQKSNEESTDVEFDKAYGDDNLAKSKSTESRVDHDKGPESEHVQGMDVDLSGMLSGTEILPLRSEEESMDIHFIESSEVLDTFNKEANLQSPGDANAESKLKSDERLTMGRGLKLCISESQCESNSGLLCGGQDVLLKLGCIDEENILEKGKVPNEVSESKATIISQTDDTDDVRSDKLDLKLEHGATDMKPDLGLATNPTLKCGTSDSSLQKDVSMQVTDSPFPLGEGSNCSLLTCPNRKDDILSTKSVLVNDANGKRSTNTEAHAPTEYENSEMETSKGVKSRNTECRYKIATNHAIMPFNLQSTPVADPTTNPVGSCHSAVDNLLSVLDLRETELSEAALGFLLHKKNELYHQLQEINDQITRCDQQIQKISNGNKDSLVLKVDTMISCCMDFLKKEREVQRNSDNQAGGYSAIQVTRPETTFKPFLPNGSACQESDNSNANICALADQLMSNSNVGAHETESAAAAAEMTAVGKPMVEQEPENH